MTTPVKMSWPKAGLLGAIFLVMVVQTVMLGREVVKDLLSLSTASTDSVQWSTAQVEVELLRAVSAMDAARQEEGSLRELRKRFDIFYSRVGTLRSSASFEDLRRSGENVVLLEAVQSYLDEAVKIIDLPDDQLMTRLDELTDLTRDQIVPVRALSLSSVATFARASDVRRAEVSQTLTRLAYSGLFLILALIGMVLILLRLLRRGQRVMDDNRVVHSRMESMVTSSLDAILVTDTNGFIVEFNGAAEDVFGYTRDEAIGHDMADLIVPEHLRRAHSAGMKRFLKHRDKRVIDAGRVRLEAKRKSGEVFPVELSITTAKAQEGEVFVSFLRDITQQVEAEAKLKRARDEARAGEKAKSDLLTIMSHEMRTPLNGILGSIQLMHRDPLSDRQKRNLQAAKVSGDLLLSHVNDVLELSRIEADAEALSIKPFDLPQLLNQVRDGLFAQAKARGNRLEVAVLTPGLTDVLGEPNYLNRCIVNLAGNAVKFTKDGVVRIEAEQVSESSIAFRISDTGMGIPEDKLQSIFDEFVTLDTSYSRSSGGTGLGLSITKRLVHRMHGELSVASTEGRGSTFTFTLPMEAVAKVDQPASDPEATIQDSPAAQLPARVLAEKSLLVVEDNEINREIITDMLAELGHRNDQAVDGFDGVEKAAAQAYDAIIMDISMPGMDGIEALGKIRAGQGASYDVPIIAATAHAAAEDHARISKAGFAGIITKPISLEQIESALWNVFGTNPSEGFVIRGEAKDTKADLRRRLGQGKAEEALRDLLAEAEGFVRSLQHARPLSPEDRAVAHKLSGLAGLLELEEMQVLLQAIEEADADDWDEDQAELTEGLAITIQDATPQKAS